MYRITAQVLATMIVAFGGAVTAVSAELPPVPVHPASAAAPPDAAAARPRAPQPPKTESTPGPENAVIPQVGVPLKRGERKPELLRPGAQDKVGGSVDDRTARCLATSSTRRADCGAASAPAASKPKTR
jgi:hypothetical protein